MGSVRGGEAHDLTEAAFVELGVPALAARRILYRQGSDASRVLEMMRAEPRTRAIVDPCEPVTDAELRVAMRHEIVRTLDDLKRRCRLGVGADGGARCAARAAQIFCEEKELPASDLPDVAAAFLQMRWQDRRGVLRGPMRISEELQQSWVHLATQLEQRGPSVDLDRTLATEGT